MANGDSKQPALSNPATLTGLGSVTVSGVAVFMLMNVQASVQELDRVVNQHGSELNLIRTSISQNQGTLRHEVQELQLDVLRVQKDVQHITSEHATLKRLLTDKDARPDAWGRSDDDRRMTEHTEYMQAWVKDLCRQKQGDGG